ncbi:MAG TPA: hypothetical protein VMP68_12085 [Candidatus Eisenbacteria bacterium]|nr:hypothetical protein [Candidatus Eisenbacteria bacterium]
MKIVSSLYNFLFSQWGIVVRTNDGVKAVVGLKFRTYTTAKAAARRMSTSTGLVFEVSQGL